MIKFLIFVVAFVAMSFAGYGGFCSGWEDGYQAGYCYENYSCISPIVPICPIPRVGEDSYQNGYNRGFMAGIKARK